MIEQQLRIPILKPSEHASRLYALADSIQCAVHSLDHELAVANVCGMAEEAELHARQIRSQLQPQIHADALGCDDVHTDEPIISGGVQ